MFVADGVYISRNPHPCSTSFKTRVFTLVDADGEDHVPAFLIQPGSHYLVTFTTSSNDKRWKGLTKTTDWELAVMNPWTRNELSNVLALSLPPLIFKLTIFSV